MVKKQLTEFQQPPAKEIVVNAVAPLTHAEAEILSMYEETIMDGLHTFVKVGEALQQIRDKRLYRVNYASFEAYCQEKWGIGRQYAYRLIGGAEVTGNLVSSIGDTALPQKEAHTRELGKLAPEAQPVAWLKAVQAAGSVEAVTADIVSRAVDEVLGKVGRFDPKLWYAVDYDSNVIYSPGEKEWGGGKNHPLKGFQWIQGDDLNDSKQYEAFQLMPIPILTVPPITDKLPVIDLKDTEAYGDNAICYPIDRAKRIIYDDPVKQVERGKLRYEGADWISKASLIENWSLLKSRYFEYTIRPPLSLVDWLPTANFKPGKLIHCSQCRKAYAFDQMVAGVHGEFWTDPEGHAIRDESTRLMKEPPAPSTEVIAPPAPTTPTEPAGTFDDEDDTPDEDQIEELSAAFESLLDFDEFLLNLRQNADFFHELLNLRQDLLDEFRANDGDIDDNTLEIARKLLKLVQGVPNEGI